MLYVQSITDVLSNHLGWHLARLKFMARFTSALLTQTTTDLWQLALALKAGVEQESNHRRIQRFLSDYEMDFPMLGRLLVHVLPETPPYKVVVDRTEWYFGEAPVNVLTMGIAHEKMAFPVAWTVCPSGGSSGADAQLKVLERFLKVVDSDSIEVVLADREFISVRWLEALQAREIPFNIRLRSDRRVGDAPNGPALLARMYARPLGVGNERVLEGERCLFGNESDTAVPVRVVVRRIGSPDAKDPFLILATWGIDPGKASKLYQKRWNVETMFGAFKSRGFKLEETHLTEPDRVERLIGLLALAFTWARLVGEKRAERHGPPPKKSHGRRVRSLFRYGLDRLRSIFNTPESQDPAFFDCLRALRSPTSFLSRT